MKKTENEKYIKLKTDKTAIVFKKMYQEIEDIKNFYYLKEKELFNNKYIKTEEKNNAERYLEINKALDIQDVKIRHTSEAISNGYSKTTQDISTLLDLEPQFCTRHMKKYIDFIKIPSGTSSLFKSYSKFNVIQQIELSKKKLLFNTNSLYMLIKKHLYEVDNRVSVKIDNINKLIEEKEDIYLCKKLAQEYIDKVVNENEYRTPISDDQFNDIISNNITLLRQETLKTLISQLILRDKIVKIKRKIQTDFGKKESSSKRIQEEILNKYIKRVDNMTNISEILLDLSLLKEDSMTNQTQITRRAKEMQHTRYHLMLPGRTQAINLYGIRADSIEIPISKEDNEIKDISSIEVIISKHSLYENIEEDIFIYIKKNINKARKNANL